MANEAAMDAIGNSTRRTVLEILRTGEQTVRELTDALPVTQSAISQHMRVLREAGLVNVRGVGTRRLYSVDLDGLAEVRAWVDGFWDDVLAAFVAHVDEAKTADADANETPHDTESRIS